jgi:hypothetical protein
MPEIAAFLDQASACQTEVMHRELIAENRTCDADNLLCLVASWLQILVLGNILWQDPGRLHHHSPVAAHLLPCSWLLQLSCLPPEPAHSMEHSHPIHMYIQLKQID